MKMNLNNKLLLVLSAGHAFTDLNQGALPAILPFLIAAGGLTYVEAAGLSFAISVSASVAQPVFGILADKSSKIWFLPMGVLLAGVGLSLIGLFPDHYTLMFTVAFLSGIGIAAYHPVGASSANKLAGKNKGGNLSFFSVGGTVGVTLGPILATPIMINLGLKGTVLLVIPSVLMFIVFILNGPRIQGIIAAAQKEAGSANAAPENEWKKFLWLGLTIICRATISHTLTTFLPLYWINVLKQSEAVSGMVISGLFFFGIIATILGGQLADRIGTKILVRAGWLLLLPSVFFLTKITNPVGAALMLIPIALGIYGINTPTMLLGQRYLPKNIGFASGITLGLGVSIGGVMTPVLGKYADLHGLTAALELLAVFPLIGILVAFTLRPPAQRQAW